MPPKRKKTPEGQGATDQTRSPEGDRLKRRSDQTRQWTDAQKGPMEKSGRDLSNWSPPVDGVIKIRSGYNVPRPTREEPNRTHGGADIPGAEGSPVKVMGDGTVSKVIRDWQPGSKKGLGGNLVAVDHPNGIRTWYMHLSNVAADLKKGDTVHGGDHVGDIGRTGGNRDTNPDAKPMASHLHIRVDVHDGKAWQKVDPANFIKQPEQPPAKPPEQPPPPPPKQQPAKQVQGGQ